MTNADTNILYYEHVAGPIVAIGSEPVFHVELAQMARTKRCEGDASKAFKFYVKHL